MRRDHWGLDYMDESGTTSQPRNRLTIPGRRVLETHSAPPGFPAGLSARDTHALPAEGDNASTRGISSGDTHAAYAEAWRLAFTPVRSLLTGGFAVLVSGSTVHLFSIMTAVTVLVMQIQALFAAPSVFAATVEAQPVLRGRLVPHFLVHFFLCAVGVFGALWQCNRLGFLPTTESDWIALLPNVDLRDAPKFVGGLGM